jgi:hypothetical protein
VAHRRTIITTSVVTTLAALLCLVAFSRSMFGGDRVRWDDGAIRAALPPESRGVFDLIAALRVPDGAGNVDWAKAEGLCRSLGWPRCDREALEGIERWSQAPGGKDARSAAASAIANATWAFGSEQAARAMFRTELDRIPEADGAPRARVFLRFGIIDTNPDGQAALFAQACATDARLCDHLKEAALTEIRARFVPPGNVLPLYFTGHP